MFRLRAFRILLGYPPEGSLERAGPRLLRLTWNGGTVVIDPRTGEATAPSDADVGERSDERDEPLATAWIAAGASLAFSSSKLEVEKRRDDHRVLWRRGTTSREVNVSWSDLVLAGDDDRIVVLRGDEIHLLDGAAGERRTLALPDPISVDGASAMGIPTFDRSPLIVDGVLVIARKPSLLAVALDDVRAALREDVVVWSLVSTMPLADPHANEPARTPATGRGIALGRYVTTSPLPDGAAVVRVRRRIWVPLGYEAVDCADGTSVAWHARPPAEDTREATVGVHPLWVEPRAAAIVALSRAWSAAASEVSEPPVPAVADASELAVVPIPTRGKEAIAVARSLQIERRIGAYGPMKGALTHLRGLMTRDPEDENESRAEAYNDFLVGVAWHQGTIYEGTAFAVFPLVGILVDPKTLDREAICSALGFFAASAKDTREAASTMTRFALERCVRSLLAPPRTLEIPATDAWRRMLVVIGSMREERAPWLRSLLALDADIARLCVELDAGTSAFDLVAAAAP